MAEPYGDKTHTQNQIVVYVTDAEKEEIQKAAGEKGMSKYLLDLHINRLIKKPLYMKLEIIEALRKALRHLHKTTDLKTSNLLCTSPIAQLRREAERLEQQDRDIDYIRSLLTVLESL